MASRDSRDKKGGERFAPLKTTDKDGKSMLYEGSGSKLGDIPIVPINLNKIDADHDLLKAFHSFLYGAVGKKTVRKKNIRSFSGFSEDESQTRESKSKKLSESKKWTVAALKDLCTLLGLEKGGDKSEVVDRIVSFLFSPDAAASKGPAAKKAKKVPVVKKTANKLSEGSRYAMAIEIARGSIPGKSTLPNGLAARIAEKYDVAALYPAKLWKEVNKQMGSQTLDLSTGKRQDGGSAQSPSKRKMSDVEDTKKKGKRVKRVMEPRPASGYIMFSKAHRAMVVAAGPTLGPKDVISKLAEMWRGCSDAEKEKHKQNGVNEFEKKQRMKAGEHIQEGHGGYDEGDGDEEEEE